MMIKGKRTKRPRPSSPLPFTISSASYSGEEGGRSGGGATTSTTTATSAEWDHEAAPEHQVSSTEEEEDMAHCLILLAQGNSQITQKQQQPIIPITNKSTAVDTTATPSAAAAPVVLTGAGVYAYECKTCNRSFPSFQALGGHRASHKKPKLPTSLLSPPNAEEKRVLPLLLDDHLNDVNSGLSLQIAIASRAPCTSNNNSKPKIHECTICGAEFSSGQALGGHMRRHRALMSGGVSSVPAVSSEEAAKKTTRNFLLLDLNLPAPEDDHHHQQHQREQQSEFVFASNQKTLIFSASLVDCHY
ncbi:hypothetical protein Ancab_031824 [Ancistrocladus abbreviatus]